VATGLKETHVTEILTNPVYAGRLRTGETAGIAPLVDPALWSRVQTARERRRTRTPGRIVKRQYALRLRCLGCGRFLYVSEHGTCREIATKSAEAVSVSGA